MGSSLSPPRPGPTFEQKRRSGKEAVSDIKKKRAEHGLGGLLGVQGPVEPDAAVYKKSFSEPLAAYLSEAGFSAGQQASLVRTRAQEVPRKKPPRETALTRQVREKTGGRRLFSFSRRDR